MNLIELFDKNLKSGHDDPKICKARLAYTLAYLRLQKYYSPVAIYNVFKNTPINLNRRSRGSWFRHHRKTPLYGSITISTNPNQSWSTYAKSTIGYFVDTSDWVEPYKLVSHFIHEFTHAIQKYEGRPYSELETTENELRQIMDHKMLNPNAIKRIPVKGDLVWYKGWIRGDGGSSVWVKGRTAAEAREAYKERVKVICGSCDDPYERLMVRRSSWPVESEE